MLRKLRHKVRVLVSKSREKKKEKRRSPEWAAVRDKFLESHPVCSACGSTEKLQVHHIIPFHVNESLELDEKNLITLCMNFDECHLEIGHGDSWKCYNPHVVRDAEKHLESDEQHRKLIAESVKAQRLYMTNPKIG